MATTNKVRIVVDGMPPGYDGGSSITNPKHARHGHYSLLREQATAVMAGQAPIGRANEVELTITWERATKRGLRQVADGTNMIGGVSNTLQGIVYVDDEQVTKVCYEEAAAARDRYVVEVAPR